jgi:hypothetical protein
VTQALPRLCDEFPAKQTECGSWDVDKREHRYSRLLTASVAGAVTSIEHVSDLEAHRIARTTASQENTHGGLHQSFRSGYAVQG